MIRVGTSGWSYRQWRGRFYPEALPVRRWLEYYSEHFPTVEVNSTFYRLQRPETFGRWAEEVPEHFRFAFKASRYITHVSRLADPEEPLGRLITRVRPLGDRLGPMLAQLPPHFLPDPERLAKFLAACPADLTVAVEFRDPRWFTDEVEEVLGEYRAATVWSDYPGAESPEWDTGGFLYVRRHGATEPFAGRYGVSRLEPLAARLGAAGKDAYVYFNNDADGAAPRDAQDLLALLTPSEEPRP